MRSVLTVGLIVLLTGSALADEVYVPDPQSGVGNNNGIPFRPAIMGGSCRYQALYFALNLGARPFALKDIAFGTTWTGDFKATQLQVRVSQYKASTLVATLDQNIPNPVPVFSGPITWKHTAAAWSPMGLTGSFVWNGTDNIVVDIRYQNGSVTGGANMGACRVVRGAIPRNWAMSNYNATTRSGTDTTGGLKTRFTVDFTTITPGGKPAPGGTVTYHLVAHGDGGLPYQVGTSLGTGPIPIDTRQLHLSPDALLIASVGGMLPTIFANHSGVLDKNGQGQARLNLPPIPALVGIRLNTAFVTIKIGAPSNIKSISKTASYTIMK